MRHVDEGTLHALLDGGLRAEEPERAREVEAHLETCADCRARLEQAADLRDRATGVLASLEPETAPATTPDFQEVLARAASVETDRPGASPRERIRRQYRWTRGLAWAATIVVALGTGYLIGDLAGPEGRLPDQAGQDRAPSAAEALQEGAAPAQTADAMEMGNASRGEETGAASGAQEARQDRAQGDPSPVGAVPPTVAGVDEPSRPSAEESVGAQQAGAGAPPVVTEAETARLGTAAGERAAGELRQAEALETGAALAEEPADIGGTALKAANDTEPATAWVEVDLEAAEALVGPILVLPDAEIVRAEAAEGGERLARTVQLLPGGIEVEVVQVPAGTAEELADAVDADAAPAAAREAARPTPEQGQAVPALSLAEVRALASPDSLAASTAGVRTVSVERDDLVLTLTGPMPAEALRALAVAAAPRAR